MIVWPNAAAGGTTRTTRMTTRAPPDSGFSRSHGNAATANNRADEESNDGGSRRFASSLSSHFRSLNVIKQCRRRLNWDPDCKLVADTIRFGPYIHDAAEDDAVSHRIVSMARH